MKIKTLLSKYFDADIVETLSKILNKDIPIIIDGNQGPTGKTTLCNKLKELGFTVKESWERDKNIERNTNTCFVVISLNKTITEKVISSELFA